MSDAAPLLPEELYLRLGQVVETMPDLSQHGPVSAETHLWLGRAHALVAAAGVGSGYDAIAFTTALSNLGLDHRRYYLAQEIAAITYRALAHAEL